MKTRWESASGPGPFVECRPWPHQGGDGDVPAGNMEGTAPKGLRPSSKRPAGIVSFGGNLGVAAQRLARSRLQIDAALGQIHPYLRPCANGGLQPRMRPGHRTRTLPMQPRPLQSQSQIVIATRMESKGVETIGAARRRRRKIGQSNTREVSGTDAKTRQRFNPGRCHDCDLRFSFPRSSRHLPFMPCDARVEMGQSAGESRMTDQGGHWGIPRSRCPSDILPGGTPSTSPSPDFRP